MSVHVRHLLCLLLVGAVSIIGCGRKSTDGDGSGGSDRPLTEEEAELEIQLPTDPGPILAPADNAPKPETTAPDEPAANDQPTTSEAPGVPDQPATDKTDQPDRSDEAAGPTAEQVAAAPAEPIAPMTKTPTTEPQPVAPGDPTKTAGVVLGGKHLLQGIPGNGPLTTEQIQTWLDNPENHVVLKIVLPMGLAKATSEITGLDENPMTLAKMELGRQLYFDTRLSSDNTISCASCHAPDEAFGKHTQFGVGVEDQTGNRNSPVSFNRIVSGAQFWDGRAASLEEQAIGPIANPIEMGNTHEACVATLTGIEGYRIQFAKIFPGDKITIEQVGLAIAAFERAIVTLAAPYDYYETVRSLEAEKNEEEIARLEEDDPELFAQYEAAVAGAKPMSESARRGRDLFFSEQTQCAVCHSGANFADELYHNLGVGMDAAEPDLGRYEVTKEDKDRGAFKTPTLRNIALSAPYMHDGSQKTLEEVVDWYELGGHDNPYLSDKMEALDVTDQDKKDLIAFMTEGLTSPFSPMETGRLPE